MTIKMPDRKNVHDFIQKAPSEEVKPTVAQDMNKSQIMSFTLQVRDIAWLDEKTEALKNTSRKKVNRSKLITAGLIALQRMKDEEILLLLKEL